MIARPTTFYLMLILAWCTLALFATQQVHADYSEDEYVRQVIEEDQQNYHDNDYHQEDSGYGNNGKHHPEDGDDDDEEEEEEFDEEQRRRNEQERVKQEAADRVAADRERKFEAELERMTNEEQKKAALKQKKIDGKKVKAVLKAAKRNDLYQVLGIRNWNLKIPSRDVDIANKGWIKFTIPGFTLKETTDKMIRKQFRTRAMQVHPDKNKDGRAQEAFIAMENAATILSDKQQRKIYDDEMKLYRSDRLEANRKLVTSSIAKAWNVIRRMVKVTQTLLGPFFVPVVIIAVLII